MRSIQDELKKAADEAIKLNNTIVHIDNSSSLMLARSRIKESQLEDYVEHALALISDPEYSQVEFNLKMLHQTVMIRKGLVVIQLNESQAFTNTLEKYKPEDEGDYNSRDMTKEADIQQDVIMQNAQYSRAIEIAKSNQPTRFQIIQLPIEQDLYNGLAAHLSKSWCYQQGNITNLDGTPYFPSLKQLIIKAFQETFDINPQHNLGQAARAFLGIPTFEGSTLTKTLNTLFWTIIIPVIPLSIASSLILKSLSALEMIVHLPEVLLERARDKMKIAVLKDPSTTNRIVMSVVTASMWAFRLLRFAVRAVTSPKKSLDAARDISSPGLRRLAIAASLLISAGVWTGFALSGVGTAVLGFLGLKFLAAKAASALGISSSATITLPSISAIISAIGGGTIAVGSLVSAAIIGVAAVIGASVVKFFSNKNNNAAIANKKNAEKDTAVDKNTTNTISDNLGNDYENSQAERPTTAEPSTNAISDDQRSSSVLPRETQGPSESVLRDPNRNTEKTKKRVAIQPADEHEIHVFPVDVNMDDDAHTSTRNDAHTSTRNDAHTSTRKLPPNSESEVVRNRIVEAVKKYQQEGEAPSSSNSSAPENSLDAESIFKQQQHPHPKWIPNTASPSSSSGANDKPQKAKSDEENTTWEPN